MIITYEDGGVKATRELRGSGRQKSAVSGRLWLKPSRVQVVMVVGREAWAGDALLPYSGRRQAARGGPSHTPALQWQEASG